MKGIDRSWVPEPRLDPRPPGLDPWPALITGHNRRMTGEMHQLSSLCPRSPLPSHPAEAQGALSLVGSVEPQKIVLEGASPGH